MSDLFTWLESLPLSTFIRQSNSLWAFPMFLFAHTLGMSIVAGGASMIDLALLGCWRCLGVGRYWRSRRGRLIAVRLTLF